jgi:putative membrane protein
MLSVSDLPLLNAFLNTASTVLLLVGHQFIRRGNRAHHKKMMLGAFTTSILFLISYIVYHVARGAQHFGGDGLIRPIYFLILGTHTILAAALVPMVLTTLFRALKGEYEKHRKIAEWTYPVWLYVSVTGVIIYLMLYQIFPVRQTM